MIKIGKGHITWPEIIIAVSSIMGIIGTLIYRHMSHKDNGSTNGGKPNEP